MRYQRGKDLKERLEQFRNAIDPKENADSTPPEEETIHFACLWAVEFYSPAHTDDLIKHFDNLGWNDNESLHNPIHWLQGLKRDYKGGAWLNLGILIPPDSTLFFTPAHTYRVPLPQHVEYALAGIHALTPSLNCITVCFVFESGTNKMVSQFDDILRAKYETTVTPTGTGWRYHTPRNQKQERVREIRSNLSDIAKRWYAEHLPGVFSSGLLNGQIPTCEFITTRIAKPFTPREEWQSGWIGYTFPLGIDSHHEAWKYTSIPGLKLRLSFLGEKVPQYHSILAIREEGSTDDCPDNPEDTAPGEEVYRINDIMGKWISAWSILPLLDGYIRSIKDIRDSSILRDRKARRNNPMKTLSRLGQYISHSVDVSAVAGELAEVGDWLFKPSYDGGSFKPCNTQRYGDTSLSDMLLWNIRERAKWVHKTDATLRDQLAQYGSLIGIAENVRLQKKVNIFTLILLVFAIVTWVLPFLLDLRG